MSERRRDRYDKKREYRGYEEESRSKAIKSGRQDKYYNELDYVDKETASKTSFKWHKKGNRSEKDKLEAEQELKKLYERRLAREREQEQREAERLVLQREKDLISLGDWQGREIKFHYQQMHKKAHLRILNQRAEPIDLLAIISGYNTDTLEEDFIKVLQLIVPLEIPYKIIENLKLEEIKELNKEVLLFLELEEQEDIKIYWQQVMYLIKQRLNMLDQPINKDRIPQEVLDQINSMMKGKDLNQLNVLQEKIQSKLSGNQPIDIDYWELNLNQVKLWKVKVKLELHYNKMLKYWKELLQNKQLELAQQNYKELLNEMKLKNIIPKDRIIYDPIMSPKLIPINSDLLIVNIQEERLNLLKQRKEVLKQVQGFGLVKKNEFKVESSNENKNQDNLDPRQFAAKLFNEERQGKILRGEELDEDEEIFDVEAKLDSIKEQKNDTSLKKPLYFNRVNVGYEWNKYNQTHYDLDNPPPKTVQGYKFHINYKGLLKDSKGKDVTPTYKLIPDPLSQDTEIILFTAGPPYSDIAFRIVKKEWEVSHKKGFKSAFINNTLYLYFTFKKLHYRR